MVISKSDTVPCATCGDETMYTGTKRCNNCWEVENRLRVYVKAEAGRKFIRDLLNDDPQTQMVVCAECGAAELPVYMHNDTDEEGKPAWLCDDCWDEGEE